MRAAEARAGMLRRLAGDGGLAEQIAIALGLDFTGDKATRLQASLEQALRAGVALPAGQRPLSQDEIAELLPHLVVGETYFLRDPETTQVLVEHFLSPLIERRRREGMHTLAIWSAASCTGEEAYSLLFRLHEMLGDDAPNWRIDLLATDINPAFIAQAEAGRYGIYAFRQSDPAWRARYFDEDRSGLWRVKPAWRDGIRFAVHNLAGEDYALAAGGFDLILCRNVLMYLTREATRHALSHLQACLRPGGVVLLSAAESGLANGVGFDGELLGLGYAVASRYGGPTRPASPRPVGRPASEIALPAMPARPKPSRPPKAPPPPPVAMAQPVTEVPLASATERDVLLDHARVLAEAGDLAGAESACRQVMHLAPFDIAPYWLLALAFDATGDTKAALANLHKITYLDPGFALASYLEGQIQLRLGQRKPADRALARCLRCLDAHDGDALLPLGDGLSVAQLRQLCLASRGAT